MAHAAETLTGNNQPNALLGEAGADQLSGLAGNDTLSGGEGADRILGGAGNDVLYGFGAQDAQAGSGRIVAQRVASGFDAPVFLTHAAGDADHVYVVEKSGQIIVLNPETGAKSTFLTIPDGEMQDGGEQGLLGLAFHPDYDENGKFYIYLVNEQGDLEIRAGTRSAGNPLVADAATDVILTIPHPTHSNHNGGWLGFGPDGMLYIATGDGGSGGDPDGNAQNLNSLLGKMLRIDVNSDAFAGDPDRDYALPQDNATGADEIWASGLRNPWRPSFDKLTGDLYIADVGQGAWEEINFQANGTGLGANFGWDWREGAHPHEGNNPPPGLIDPIHEYSHEDGQSITGGYVYRGTGPGMQGVYFFADFITNQLWSFRVVDGVAQDFANRTPQLLALGGSVDNISSFGEDAQGNLYIVGIDGEIFRLTPRVAAGDGADYLLGNDGNDRILGGIADDTLKGGTGRDSLFGGDQNDQLFGGSELDQMTGGSGGDRFVFVNRADSAGQAIDRITDFGTGADRIGLNQLDANSLRQGNQDFRFIGQQAFDQAGQVRAIRAGQDVLLLVNTDNDKAAEMTIRLSDVSLASITRGDFIL